MARNLAAQAMLPAAMPQDIFALELQALAQQMGSTGWQRDVSAGAALPAVKQPNGHDPRPVAMAESASSQTLQDVLAFMEGFLSRAAGLDALPIALMLAQITSLTQLRRELPSYRQLIQSYGVDAEVHGQQLTSLLDRAGV